MNKIVALLLNSFLILFGINTAVHIFEYFLVFKDSNQMESTFYFFYINIIFRYLLIYWYDHSKIDKFKIEWLKKNLSQIFLEQNSFISKVHKLNKIRNFINKVKWLKWLGDLIFFIGLCIIEPLFAILFLRKGSYEYNDIPDLQTLSLFLLANLFSGYTVFYTYKAIFILNIF